METALVAGRRMATMIVVKVVLESLIADYQRHPWFLDGAQGPPEGLES